ncbi:MAG: transporter substrate-binding domain-containing protein [Pedosphaera sp.]|nr:transporter substrate-binding domain-containing protein [Pedosphaera sp.]
MKLNQFGLGSLVLVFSGKDAEFNRFALRICVLNSLSSAVYQAWFLSHLRFLAGCLLLSVFFQNLSRAEIFNSTQPKGDLRWANDAEGGAPYIFHPSENPERLVGFEVEFAEALCQQLGKKSRFIQYNWANLISGLRQGGNFDIIIAALERTPENLLQVAMSRPYYVFGQQLITRISDATVNGLTALRGRSVGVLGGTLSFRLATAHDGLVVRVYDDNINYFHDLELGRIDAILTDSPIAEGNLRGRTSLRRAGPAFEPAYYAVAVPLADTNLLARIDVALLGLIEDGTLKRIYSKYGLWDANQARLALWKPDSVSLLSTVSRPQTFHRRWVYLPILLKAAVTTLWVSVSAMMIAMLLGLFLAVARVYGPLSLRWLAIGYIEIFRGTPLLLQLYFIYFGLAQQLGWKLSAGTAAVLTLGLNYAASEAENYRAGLQSVPRGQAEAAFALGLSPWLTFRRILLPQAFRISLPSVTNDFIALFKDSSIVSVIGLVELTKEFLIRSLDAGDYLGLGLITAAIYFVMGHIVSQLARLIERRLHL